MANAVQRRTTLEVLRRALGSEEETAELTKFISYLNDSDLENLVDTVNSGVEVREAVQSALDNYRTDTEKALEKREKEDDIARSAAELLVQAGQQPSRGQSSTYIREWRTGGARWDSSVRTVVEQLQAGVDPSTLREAIQAGADLDLIAALWKNNDVNKVNEMLIQKVAPNIIGQLLKAGVTTEDGVILTQAGISTEDLHRFKKQGIDLNNMLHYVKAGNPKELLLALSLGKIDETGVEALRAAGVEPLVAAPAIKAGATPDLLIRLSGLLKESPGFIAMGLEAGLSEDTLLTIVEQVEGGVDDISDRGKIEITDSTPESFKVAALEQREHERNVLTAQILEKVTSRAYELSKYAKGLITYDTTLGILDAVIEDGLRDISYDGTGELQRPLITTQTWTKFLSRLVEALGPRDVNKALKELNKVINETREKNGLAAVNRTGWTGEKFSSQDPKKQVAATIEKLDGVPTNLDETYKRIAAVVDWYAIVLTDKLWTPNNAPAIIDRRSDLFGQIETLLIQVQDHPLMNGTVNPELDKDAATTPAPQDLLALTAQLEAAMNEAWVKALEMGENYDKTQNPELDQHTLNAIQDLIVKEKKLDYEAAEAYRKARLMLADEEQTPKGESSRLKGNELLREQGTLLAEMNEVKAQRERLEMGTETITNRIRILANSPRLSGRTPQKGLTQGD